MDLDSFWSSMDAIDGDGIYYHNITFKNWTGTAANGEERAPIRILCPPDVPCTDISVEDISIGTDVGGYEIYVCENAFGSGYCVSNATDTTSTYTTTLYASPTPSGASATTMAEYLTTGFGTTESIPIPTIPASFYPGVTPYSAVASPSVSS